MTDLSTTYLGLRLRTPLVASSSPLTSTPDGVRKLADAGISAVVLPSLFEEQLAHEAATLDELLWLGSGSSAEAEGYFPALDDYNTGPERYLRLVLDAKKAVDVPVIASLNGSTFGGMATFARQLESSGADAIELNIYMVAADPATTAFDLEQRYIDIVATVRDAVDVPLAVKVSPFFTAFAHTARSLVAAGADGLVMFNRFYQPDIDIQSLTVGPHLVLSSPQELRLRLRWLAIVRPLVEASLAATGGVHDATDVAKALLVGADVTMMASVLLRRGLDHVGVVERELTEWMADHEYESVRQLKGSMSQSSVPDTEAFERAGYLKELLSFKPTT
jgi:dihydroorotate dehydrogenase (fumarate)